MLRAIAIGVVAASCGSSSPSSATIEVAIDHACGPITQWTFSDTPLAAASEVTLLATRTDTGDPATLALTIDGDAAGDFTVVADASTCDDAPTFATDDVCIVQLEFAPSALGTRSATMHLGATAIPLAGNGVTAGGGLTTNIVNLDLAFGMLNTAQQATLTVVNDSGQTQTLGDALFTGSGFIATSPFQCASRVLTPGGACAIIVTIGQTQRGCVSGSLTIPGSTTQLDVAIDDRFIAGVIVDPTRGAGTGHIVSNPPGIDCPGTCSRVFSEDSVVLTQTPDPGNQFVAWTDPACGYSDTCTVATTVLTPQAASCTGPPAVSISTGSAAAAFATPSAHAIQVTIAGTGYGTVEGRFPTSTSYTTWAEDGTGLSLLARSPELFTGWSGACVGTSSLCDLGPIVRDRDVTATFDRDPHGTGTVLPSVPASTGAFASNGDLFVGGSSPPCLEAQVSRVSPAGATSWSVALGSGSVLSVRASSDAVYVLTTSTLTKLSAAGAIVWSVAATPPVPIICPYPCTLVDALAVTPAGDAAIVTGAAVQIRSQTDASVVWTRSVGANAVAVSATGIVAVVSGSTVSRFDAAGTALASFTLPSTTTATLAFDSQGDLVAYQHGLLTRFATNGATVFSNAAPSGTFGDPAVVAIGSGDEIVTALPHGMMSASELWSVGAIVNGTSPLGTVDWTADKSTATCRFTQGISQDLICDGANQVTDLVCAPGAGCAAFGSYLTSDVPINKPLATPWIERFQ